MIIRAEKEKLINALTPAMGAVSNTNTISAVEGILFETSDAKNENGNDIITLSAYDMEKGMRTSIEATVEESGGAIINAQKLYQIVRLMPDGEITISVDKSLKAVISAGSSNFELRALEAEAFPALPELSGDHTFSVPQYILKSFISHTFFAINPNENRAAFRGAFFKIKGDKITVVTCDGNRLAKCEHTCDLKGENQDSEELDFSFIIPGKTLAEFNKIIKDTEDDVKIELARKHVIMRVGDIIYFSRLIDTEYIDYERIIPKTSTVTVIIDAEKMRRSLERAALVTEDKTVGSVRSFVKLSVHGNTMEVSSVSVNGSVSDEIEITHEGEDIEIGFNCRFLLDVLKVCDGEIKILMSTPMMGISISKNNDDEAAEDNSEGDYFYFVMPVRMNGASN